MIYEVIITVKIEADNATQAIYHSLHSAKGGINSEIRNDEIKAINIEAFHTSFLPLADLPQ